MQSAFLIGINAEPFDMTYFQCEPSRVMVTFPGLTPHVLTLFAQCGSGH